MPEKPDSVKAYDLPSRVAEYDSDMEIMHPLRSKMADVILEALPWSASEPLRCVDLGVGTGMLTARVLKAYPNSAIVAVDGAAAMMDLCRARLGAASKRVEFVVSDFQTIPADCIREESIDAVFSAYALHHLTREAKRGVIAQALRWVRPGGWFLNADLVVARSPEVELRIQELREAGIVERANGDGRFLTRESTRAYLAKLEAGENDQPLTLAEDLEIARAAGLHSVEVFWKEYREAVWGGPRA